MMDLVIKAKAGYGDAMGELFNMFTPLLIKNIRAMYVKGYEEEDLKQIGYMSIMKAVSFFNLEEEKNFKLYSFKGYIKSAVVNNYNCLVRDKYKDSFVGSLNMKTKDGFEIEELLVDEMDIEQQYVEKELNAEKKFLVDEILSSLSEIDKELLEYIYIKDEGTKKYAEITNLKYSTCLKRKLRLLEKLRSKYKGYKFL